MRLSELNSALLEAKTDLTTERESVRDAPAPGGKMGSLLSTAQAARILGVSMSRVRQFKAEGRLEGYANPTAGQRDTFYKESDIYAFKREGRRRTGRPEGSTEDKLNKDDKAVSKLDKKKDKKSESESA